MSVRKRTWTTAEGVEKTAWVVDYRDQGGKRRLKTFARKKDADAFKATAVVEVRQGVHTPELASITVAAAAADWLKSAAERGLERATCDTYRQHVEQHLLPFIGRLKLAQLTVPVVRDLELRLRAEGRSDAMVRKVLVSLSSSDLRCDGAGRVNRNAVREMKGHRKVGRDGRAEARRRGKLKVGVDIPRPDEIKAIIAFVKGRWRPLILTAIFTGLRASELRGLRWEHVNLDAGELHVGRARRPLQRHRQAQEARLAIARCR